MRILVGISVPMQIYCDETLLLSNQLAKYDLPAVSICLTHVLDHSFQSHRFMKMILSDECQNNQDQCPYEKHNSTIKWTRQIDSSSVQRRPQYRTQCISYESNNWKMQVLQGKKEGTGGQQIMRAVAKIDKSYEEVKAIPPFYLPIFPHIFPPRLLFLEDFILCFFHLFIHSFFLPFFLSFLSFFPISISNLSLFLSSHPFTST